MKTLFNKVVAFACLLLVATVAKAATTVTVADHENLPTTYGTLSGSYLFTTNAASGVAGLTIQAANSDVTLGTYDLSSNTYPYGKGIKLVTSDTDSHTITLTAPTGYIITDYSIGASANTSDYPHTLTAADGTTTSGSIIGLGSNSNNFQYLTVSGLNTNSTYFTIQTANGGNTLFVAYFTVTLRKYETSITSGKYYRLHNANYSDKAMRELSGVLTTEAPDDDTYSQLWKITESGSGYSLQNAATGKYIQAATTYSQQFQTGSSTVTFYSGTQTENNLTKFWFSTANNTSTERALHCNSSYNVVSWLVTDPSYWYLEVVEVDADVIAALQAQATLSSGYYRLTSAAYTDRSMADGGGVVSTTPTSSSYAQVWYLTISGSTCTLKNVLTEKYIQGQSGPSVQYQTGESSHTFNIISKESGGSVLYTFQDPNSTWYGLHSAASQSYNVVGWNYADDASYWTLEKVEVDQTELENLKSTMATDYTSQLETFFEDAACTTLKSTYASITEAQLRSAMSSLPSALQNMAVRVKSDTWNSDSTYNSYEKDFRIHAYDIFSNSDLWYDITKTGPFAHLFHPTGIQAETGDFVYLFVSDNVQDSDATLQVECVASVDRKGAAYTLTQGYNIIYVPFDCELFVSYLLNNTAKSCDDYPKITVHIEGGTCNGCFDMRGHGHTNEDWEWMKTNMFSGTYLHVKGNSTMLNCYRERVVDTSNTQNVVGIMNIFDFVFDTEETLCGNDQWKTTGRYKMMTNNFDSTSGNPYWSNGNYGYAQPGIWYSGIFNYDNLANVGTDGGHIWVIEHELGHGHQEPIKMAGTTESTNNSLAQCVNLLAKDNIGTNMFQTTRSSRNAGVNGLMYRFNNNSGYSWIDYGGMRTTSGTYDDTWISNRFIFQLWLYFDYMGNYQPEGGNTGYSFMNALYDALRSDPLVSRSPDSSSPSPASGDYLKLAQYAAQITQTDLSEFFEAWGFWKLDATVAVDGDIAASRIWKYGDYGTYYMQTDESYVTTVKTAMQQYTKKAGNIMFLEDRCTGSTLATYNGNGVSTFGDTGYYGTFDAKVTSDYTATVSGTTVTMSGGTGAVGFKVYDGDGNLVAISNTTSFTVTSDVATGINDGTYTVKVAQGNGDDYIAASTNHTATHYEEAVTGVPYAMTNPSQLTSSTLFTMNCARGYVCYNGSAVAGTSSTASEFAIVSYGSNTYLYDATQKAFVCHTTAAKAGGNGNAALESSSDFSKIVKNISFGATGFESYPWYVQEDEFTNWLNMDGTPLVYFNRWTDFEGGVGGNTYNVTIVDVQFDPAEAIAMLDAYFNPSATLKYVISEANGDIVYQTEPAPATIGETITALPSDLQRDFCTYSTINHTIVTGENTINVTVTYDLPFETGTGKLYFATLRGHYVYYDATNSDVRTNQSSKENADAYKWSFSGNPYDGIKVKSEATGTYLDNTATTVQLTEDGYAWTIHRLNDTSTFGLYNGSNYINEQNQKNHNLIYWWAFADDTGSQWNVEEVPAEYDYAADVVDRIGMYFAEGATLDTYFTISSTTKALWQTKYAQYSVSATEAQYNEIVDAVTAAIVYPESGRYRIKSRGIRNSGTPTYITCDDGATLTTTTTSDGENSIFTLTGTYPNFQLSVAGKNLQAFAYAYDDVASVSDDEANTTIFNIVTPGWVTIQNYPTFALDLHESWSHTIISWMPSDEGSWWTIEDAAVVGDVDGNGDVDETDLQMLLDILCGKVADTGNSDVDGNFSTSLSDVTALVNILMRRDEE